MRSQWPHATLRERAERAEHVSPVQLRTRTRYLPLERSETLPSPSDLTITLSLKLTR